MRFRVDCRVPSRVGTKYLDYPDFMRVRGGGRGVEDARKMVDVHYCPEFTLPLCYAPSHSYHIRPPAMLVSFFISSPDTHSERRFDSDLTAGQLKVGW